MTTEKQDSAAGSASPSAAGLGGAFLEGINVRCHADCLTNPEVHRCFDGPLLTIDNRGKPWWKMRGRDGDPILVHENELEMIVPPTVRLSAGLGPALLRRTNMEICKSELATRPILYTDTLSTGDAGSDDAVA